MVSDKVIIIKLTDFGNICQMPQGLDEAEANRLIQHIQSWLDGNTKWLVLNTPIEIIDCRIITKNQ